MILVIFVTAAAELEVISYSFFCRKSKQVVCGTESFCRKSKQVVCGREFENSPQKTFLSDICQEINDCLIMLNEDE